MNSPRRFRGLLLATIMLTFALAVHPAGLSAAVIPVQFSGACPPQQPGQSQGDGPVPAAALKNMIKWGSGGFDNGASHKNESGCKITSIKIQLTSAGDTFDPASNGGTAFPVTSFSADMKTMVVSGGNIQPGATFWSKVPASAGEGGVGEYTGQAFPAKPKDADKKKVQVPEEPDSGNDGSGPGQPPHSSYDGNGGFSFEPGSVNYAQYTDGTIVHSNSATETIIGAEIMIEPMQLVEPSPELPGAFRLTDSFVSVKIGQDVYLKGALHRPLLIPDESVPGFDSVVQAELVWASGANDLISEFMDELFAVQEPAVSAHVLFRSNLLGTTNNLATPGTSTGVVEFTNAAPVGFGIPTISEWGVIILGLLTLTAGTIVLRRRRTRMAPAGG